MKKTKKVLYSCITGGYDNIPVHKYVAPDWDYVLFTDNADLIKAGHFAHWTIRPLVFDKLTNVKNSRWHKVNPHKLFPEYDYSLYLDANIIVNNDNLFKLADNLIKQNVLFAVPNHPQRTCCYAEAEIIKSLKIDYPETVDAEMAVLRKDKYPENNGLSENNILFRQHNKIPEMLDLWWYMIEKYSKRDQLSFNYALWKTNTPHTPIYTDENGFGMHRNCSDFTFVVSQSHDQNKIPSKRPSKVWKFIVKLIGCFIPVKKYRKLVKQKLMGK